MDTRRIRCLNCNDKADAVYRDSIFLCSKHALEYQKALPPLIERVFPQFYSQGKANETNTSTL